MGVNVDCSELKEFSKQLEKLKKEQADLFFRIAAKQMAARLLALVIPRTPVGQGTFERVNKTNKDGSADLYKINYRGNKKGSSKTKLVRVKQGGTLRRGWTAKTEAEAGSGQGKDPLNYAQSLQVTKIGNQYRIEVINPVHYASYVEQGHRQKPGRFVPAIGKKLVSGWVEGKHFLSISEEELKLFAPVALQQELELFLKGVF